MLKNIDSSLAVLLWAITIAGTAIFLVMPLVTMLFGPMWAGILAAAVYSVGAGLWLDKKMAKPE